MATKTSTDSDLQPFVVTHAPLVVTLLALSLMVGFSSMWWSKVHDSPRRVWQGMLSNNLSTASVTRQTIAGNTNSSIDKYDQLNFVPPVSVHSYVTMSQTAGSAISRVTTETIGTHTDDFSRYLAISTSEKGANGKALDFRSVENIWGKTDITVGQAKYLTQSAVGLLLFGNLDANTSKDILGQINSQKIYTVDYSKVKPRRLNGRSALIFPVKVNIAMYIGVLKTVAKANGVSNLADLDASAQSAAPIELSMTVDKRSRQVMEVSYANQKEIYTGYGLNQLIQTPDKTIPVNDLQARIGAIK